jgi:hypothetical protein
MLIATLVLLASLGVMSVGYAQLSGIPWLGTLKHSWPPPVLLFFACWTFVSWMKSGSCRVNRDLKALALVLLAFFGPMACYQLEGALPEVIFTHRVLFMALAIPAIVWKIPRYYDDQPPDLDVHYSSNQT